MSEWFYTSEGAQNGPVRFDQLKELVRNGQLNEQDLVWNASMSDWQSANKVEGLFEAQIPSTDPANPYAAPQSAWQEPATVTGAGIPEIEPGSDPIDVGACVKRGFELTKQNFGTIILVGLVYIGAFFAISFVGGMIQGLVGATATNGTESPQNMGAPAAIAIIVGLINQVFSFYLGLGMTRIGLNLVSGKQVAVGQLFGEGGKLPRVIGASILYFLMVFIGLLLLVVPGIYLALRFMHYQTAIVDRNMGVIESLSYSSSITTNNRLNLFLLGILSFAIAIAGVLALFVGLIFAIPVVWLASMAAYRWMQYGRRAVEDYPGTKTPLLSGV